jgi:hypothetical protein
MAFVHEHDTLPRRDVPRMAADGEQGDVVVGAAGVEAVDQPTGRRKPVAEKLHRQRGQAAEDSTSSAIPWSTPRRPCPTRPSV